MGHPAEGVRSAGRGSVSVAGVCDLSWQMRKQGVRAEVGLAVTGEHLCHGDLHLLAQPQDSQLLGYTVRPCLIYSCFTPSRLIKLTRTDS